MPPMSDNELILENFLPYRLSYLTNIISRKLAGLYSQRFGITTHEWKIMANLNHSPDISAAEVGERTVMDKVAVSRAVSGLCDKGLVDKIFSPQDRRRSVLSLTKKGKKIYGQIEPLVTGYEKSLLTILSRKELSQLDHLLTKLTGHVTI